MATKKRKSTKKRKTSKRRKGLRGLGNAGIGKKVAMFLTSVVAGNLAHEGVYQLSKLDFMKSDKPVAEGGSTSSGNWKMALASGGLTLLGGGLAVITKNEWVNSISTAVGVGASIHLKDEVVMPAMGLGAVDDFLDLYRTDAPLKDLSGIEDKIQLQGVEDELMRKLA